MRPFCVGCSCCAQPCRRFERDAAEDAEGFVRTLGDGVAAIQPFGRLKQLHRVFEHVFAVGIEAFLENLGDTSSRPRMMANKTLS
mmetsp:Transcript_177722/g.569775  ORF Transcript_177722/g.569775 Transcript_177722/m.569775 type:complete len:85 (-) Transcript_177722:526-780(-)